MRTPRTIRELPTPALIVDVDAFEGNLTEMARHWPAARLRPHVKAHKCTAIAARQVAHGHHTFTAATPGEIVGMARAGVGSDLLLANETLDTARLAEMAAAQDRVLITVAVDSPETIAAAAHCGIRHVLIDVNVGLPRCGCAPEQAGRLAAAARAAGLEVRGVMGYEGHLMMVADGDGRREQVAAAMDLLLAAHAEVGGAIISAGGTGTFDVHDRITELQAGSYALMDAQYARRGLPFTQALFVVGTVISANDRWSVADVGLKALGMDHGNPSIDGQTVWFCSDEHVTFAPAEGGAPIRPGERVQVVPAHVDPTMAMHEAAWLVRGDDLLERWAIDLRGW